MGRVRDAGLSLVEGFIAPGEFSVCYRCQSESTLVIGPYATPCPRCRAGEGASDWPEIEKEQGQREAEAVIMREFRERLAKGRSESGLYAPKFWESWIDAG